MFQISGANSPSYLPFVEAFLENGTYTVQTSGSTGIPKTIEIDFNIVKASAQHTNDFFKLNTETQAANCLSANTIGGLMMLARALVGNYAITCLNPSLNPDLSGLNIDFISMAPLQLHELLTKQSEGIRKIPNILVGGGEISDLLQNQLEKEDIVVWNSYGMTETYSHVALKKSGKDAEAHFTGIGDARFTLHSDEQLSIHAPWISDSPIQTTDVVTLLDDQKFIWHGRADFMVNSGGVKLNLEKIEKILNQELDITVFLWREKDEQLGERLVLLTTHVFEWPKEKWLRLVDRYEIPKRFYLVSEIIRGESLKIQRQQTYLLKTKKQFEAVL